MKALYGLVKHQPSNVKTSSYIDAWDLRRLYTFAFRRQLDAAKREQRPRDWLKWACSPTVFGNHLDQPCKNVRNVALIQDKLVLPCRIQKFDTSSRPLQISGQCGKSRRQIGKLALLMSLCLTMMITTPQPKIPRPLRIPMSHGSNLKMFASMHAYDITTKDKQYYVIRSWFFS